VRQVTTVLASTVNQSLLKLFSAVWSWLTKNWTTATWQVLICDSLRQAIATVVVIISVSFFSTVLSEKSSVTF